MDYFCVAATSEKHVFYNLYPPNVSLSSYPVTADMNNAERKLRLYCNGFFQLIITVPAVTGKWYSKVRKNLNPCLSVFQNGKLCFILLFVRSIMKYCISSAAFSITMATNIPLGNKADEHSIRTESSKWEHFLPPQNSAEISKKQFQTLDEDLGIICYKLWERNICFYGIIIDATFEFVS